MTKEEKEAVLHCLRAMIDEELCEECPLYGTTGTDHCEKDCVRLAIEELEQGPCKDAISRQTGEDAIKKLKDILEEATETDNSVCYVTSDDADALNEAIEAIEQLSEATEQLGCLTDRPCDVCRFKTKDGCYRWECVFKGV